MVANCFRVVTAILNYSHIATALEFHDHDINLTMSPAKSPAIDLAGVLPRVSFSHRKKKIDSFRFFSMYQN